jgi:hypothetical protein
MNTVYFHLKNKEMTLSIDKWMQIPTSLYTCLNSSLAVGYFTDFPRAIYTHFFLPYKYHILDILLSLHAN